MTTINKMHECRRILRTLIQENIVDGRRAQFMTQAINELGMSKAAASSYYNIVKTSMVDNKDGYAAHKRANKRNNSKKVAKTVETVQEVVADQPVIAEPIAEVATSEQSDDVKLERWQVQNKISKEIIDSFTTRSGAQKAVKELKDRGEDVRWIDGLSKTA